MRIARFASVGLGTAAFMIAGSGAAMAGEITGTGEPTQGPMHAHSFCVFSGHNDSPSDPAPEGGIAQSYGQFVRQGLKAYVPSPGDACNPTKPPPEE